MDVSKQYLIDANKIYRCLDLRFRVYQWINEFWRSEITAVFLCSGRLRVHYWCNDAEISIQWLDVFEHVEFCARFLQHAQQDTFFSEMPSIHPRRVRFCIRLPPNNVRGFFSRICPNESSFLSHALRVAIGAVYFACRPGIWKTRGIWKNPGHLKTTFL